MPAATRAGTACDLSSAGNGVSSAKATRAPSSKVAERSTSRNRHGLLSTTGLGDTSFFSCNLVRKPSLYPRPQGVKGGQVGRIRRASRERLTGGPRTGPLPVNARTTSVKELVLPIPATAAIARTASGRRDEICNADDATIDALGLSRRLCRQKLGEQQEERDPLRAPAAVPPVAPPRAEHPDADRTSETIQGTERNCGQRRRKGHLAEERVVRRGDLVVRYQLIHKAARREGSQSPHG